MLAGLRDPTSRERKTMLACWGGWTLDGFDQQLYSYVVPTVIAVWGVSSGAVGTIGIVTVVRSRHLARPACALDSLRHSGIGSVPGAGQQQRAAAPAQGFCYDAGRAIGSVFMTAIGFAAAVMPLGTVIALFSTLAHTLMIVMLLLLPETRGRAIVSLEAEAPDTAAYPARPAVGSV